ncbi:MAG: hypothetical protein WBB60_09525 [Nitrospira sp.]|jgi:hypothetical protein|nr:hypothetical protein [Nitrospira sp.]MBP6606852.1 hypothetical protein [Nitrospira sp.]HQY59532.1 hypothetical protein [Nitrospira sp.]HRA96130.1 hypothetical protein [Nitrospira sp.]
MTTFPNSPKLLKGGIVLIDPATARVQRIIVLQYNPDSLSRTLQVQGAGEGGDRSEALRLKGPAVETIKLEAEIDATDEMEQGEAVVGEVGIAPQLAALETLLYPSSGQLTTNHTLSSLGTLEILPMETALPLFVFGQNRVIPVRLTDFSVTEEAFDPNLNPTRAKVSLGMRVLSIDDVGFTHKAGSLFMSYLQQKEGLRAKAQSGTLGALGLTGIQ